MQVTENSADGLKRELKIVIPAQDIESRIDKKLSEVGRRVRVPGFRPGKVPQKVLKQRFGDAVKGEALEEAVSEGASQAISDQGIRPALQPKVDIDKYDEGQDLEFTLSVEALPDIEPIDFSKLKLTQYKVAVPESEVEDALKRMAESQKQSEPMSEDRPAKDGDIVVIDFVGKLGGEPFDGGSAEDYQLELGTGTFIPGFEEQLKGVKAGDEKQVTVTFPEEYGAEHLAGKEVVFDVKVKELRQPVPAKIDDELAKSYGQESLEDLKKLVREQLEKEYSTFTRERLKRDLLDVLSEKHDFEVPTGMVEGEFETIWHQYQEHQKQHEHGEGHDHDHDHNQDKPEEELKKEYRDIAERRVRLGLLLSDVGNQNEVTVEQEEVTRAIMQEAQRFPGQEAQVVEYFRSNEDALQHIRAPIFENKVVDFILEMVQIDEKEVTPEEAAKLAAGEDEEKSESEPKKKSSGTKKKTAGAKKKAAGTEKADKKAAGTKKSGGQAKKAATAKKTESD